MPDPGSLRRLGGGRWQTPDGRFTIEPQSGTWVVVDGEQTDDLRLPIVRGPFRSLGAAREAIEVTRDQGPSSSPLAARVEEAARRPAAEGSTSKGASASSHGAKGRRSGPAKPSEEPQEPPWLSKLEPARRREARELIGRLEHADLADAAKIARSEIVDDQPAVARVAIERRLQTALAKAEDAEAAALAVVEVLAGGRDRKLDVAWRLVDGEGRPIRGIDPTGT